jgi:hypothetical protein
MRLFFVSGAVAGCLLVPQLVQAQEEANSVTAGIAYVFGPSDKVIESEGAEVPNAKVAHHTMTFNAEYVTPIRGLSVAAELAITGARWDDSSLPHTPVAGEWDDGDLHFSPTDLRLGVDYQLLETPLGVELSLSGSIPVTDYPTVGYTAPGRGLKALHAGVTLLRTVDPWLPRLYLSGGYEFSLVEKYDEAPGTDDFGQNYSEFNAQIGYLVLDGLDVHAAFQGHIHHGGLNFIDFNTYTPDEQEHHDAILREQSFFVGGGLGYQITDALTIGADVRFFIAGANTRNANLFGLAASYQIL